MRTMALIGTVLIGTMMLPRSTEAARLAEPGMLSVTVETDLSCPSCAQGLERRLERLDNIAGIEILVAEGQVVLTPEPGTSVDLAAVRDVIRNAGFIPTSVGLTAVGHVVLLNGTPALALSDDAVLPLADDARSRELTARATGTLVTVAGEVRPAPAGAASQLHVDSFEVP